MDKPIRNFWIKPDCPAEVFLRLAYGTNWNALTPEKKFEILIKLYYKDYPQHFDDGLMMTEFIAWYMFGKLGRPTWRITPDLLWFLQNVNIEPMRSALTLPRDILCFAFPYGFILDGLPVRYVIVMYPKSDFSMNILVNGLPSFIDNGPKFIESPPEKRIISAIFDFGEGERRGEYSWDTPISRGEVVQVYGYNDERLYTNADGRYREQKTTNKIMKIIFACLMYVESKSQEVIKGFRYSAKGKKLKSAPNIRYIHRIKTLPRSKTEYENQIMGIQGDSKMKPHIRGWVLRTLRSDRYKRNDDGTHKTILIPPCLINAKSVDKINDTETAIIKNK